jgi:hypothetical protein
MPLLMKASPNTNANRWATICITTSLALCACWPPPNHLSGPPSSAAAPLAAAGERCASDAQDCADLLEVMV